MTLHRNDDNIHPCESLIFIDSYQQTAQDFLAWIINRLSKTIIIFGYYSHVKCIKRLFERSTPPSCKCVFNPCDLIGFERTMRDSLKNLLLIYAVNFIAKFVSRCV